MVTRSLYLFLVAYFVFAIYKSKNDIGGRQRGRVVRAPDFESGGRGFESRSDNLAEVVSW